nr:tryptophan synthase alpha chain-like [Ipomoea batatas]GME21295.1 tryptophan synthase alpha chain-like [Ipomoea batatas]
MAASLKATHFLQLKNRQARHSFLTHSPESLTFLQKPPMAALTTATSAAGISQTFTNLRQQGKVALIPYITAGDPNLETKDITVIAGTWLAAIASSVTAATVEIQASNCRRHRRR